MTFPLDITFRDMAPSPALEARIRDKAARLERFSQDLQRCRVTLEAPHRHQRQGRLYNVRIEAVMPGGTIMVTHDNPRDHAHEDAHVALRDAFDALTRKLEDHVRRRDGRVKHHEAPLLHGRVARFVAGEDYGFIAASDGREVYFHRNSVDGSFDQLQVGDEVRLAVVEGENGPQASGVHPVGRHPAGP